MEGSRTGVFVLLVLIVPVSGDGNSFQDLFTEPLTCYILDGFLIIYCIFATALYFREKFSKVPSVDAGFSGGKAEIYQQLKRPKDADPYQALNTPKRKKKAIKQKPQSSYNDSDEDPYESPPPPSY